MSHLPAGLRFGRPAIDGLPRPHVVDRAGPARAPDQIEQPGRVRRALGRPDHRPPAPRSPAPRMRPAAPRPRPRPAAVAAADQGLRPPHRRRQTHVDPPRQRTGTAAAYTSPRSAFATARTTVAPPPRHPGRAHQERRRGPERQPPRMDQRLGHRRADPEAGEAPGPVAQHDAASASPSVTPARRSSVSISGSSAPRAAAPRRASPRAPRAPLDAERHRRPVGGGIDARATSERLQAAAARDRRRWWSRNRRVGAGASAPARSGHSIRSASPSASSPSQSRSAASSGERSRKQSRWNTGPRAPW